MLPSVSRLRISRGLAALALLGLGACGSGPQLRNYPVSTKAVELENVPFQPQEGYQGGPAALSMMLAASQAPATPAELVPRVYDSGTGEVPQNLMRSAASRYGRVAYVLKSKELDLDVVRQVQAGHPVLLLLRTGTMMKHWQYAVVIGVDPGASTYTLRTGSEQRRVLPYGELLAAWKDSSYWAMLVLPPENLPEAASATDWLGPAAQMEQAGKAEAAALAYAAVTRRWPENAPAWAGLGRSSYATHDLRGATDAYVTALRLQPNSASAHNGLALALLDRQCADQAEDEVALALALENDPNLRNVYLRTQREVAKHSGPSVVCQLE